MLSEADLVLQRIAGILDSLDIEYLVGGSIASSVHGIPRLTNDIDVVVDLKPEQVDALVAVMEPDFYIDRDMVLEALRERSSFNVIYQPLVIKTDFFIRPISAWNEEVWRRRRYERVGSPESEPVLLASAEDTILQKLYWYRLTGERSDRQWSDIQGVIRTQVATLDREYLKRWAAVENLTDLLARALQEAGIEDAK